MPDQTTPRPWAWKRCRPEHWMIYRANDDEADRPIFLSASAWHVRTPEGKVVLLTPDHPDAAFIVRAVNAHDALIHALGEMVELAGMVPSARVTGTDARISLYNARAVLARAKELP